MSAPPVLHIDYETRSLADLKKVGLDIYAAHPSTEIMCAAYAFDEGPVGLWKALEGEPAPPDVVTHIKRGGEIEAWNAPFEMLITNGAGVRHHGMPEMHPEQVTCAMVKAYAMGLPGSLENGAAALGIEQQKDLAGGRLTLQMAKPRAINPECQDCGGSGMFMGVNVCHCVTWWGTTEEGAEERRKKMYAYCRQDVVVERMASGRMPRLTPYERKVWELDYKINRRGITVDVPAITNAIVLVEKEKERLNAEMRTVTKGEVATCTAVAQIKNYLQFFGVSGESLDKASVIEFLSDKNLDPTARRVLELRAEAGKAATSKFGPMVSGAGEDNRVRGCYQYSGANTRRWAGRRIQLHNLKRPTLKFSVIESIIESIRAGATVEELSMCFGNPMNILGDCTRSFLMAAPGNELLVADFSAIEARVLAWLAGQESVLEVFRRKEDIYKVAASAIFGVPIEMITDDQRQVGKVAILALGYGGGVGAFQTMAKTYNVKMAPAFGSLWMRADPEQRIRSEKTYEAYVKKMKKLPDEEPISREEFLASDVTKIFWRKSNPAIVEYWAELEQAAIRAVQNPGTFQTPGEKLPRIVYKKSGSFLWCLLPGGGVICYPYPEIRKVKTPWGTDKMGLTYMAEDGQSHQWLRYTTYGGSLAENITQAVSRDLLADSMLRLDSQGFNIVIHTHDEAGCEHAAGERQLDEMIRIMTTNPEWARGLPIAAAGFVSKRYRK